MYPTYKDLCINVLLRLGEDKNISNGAITKTNTVTGYLKTIPLLLNDALNICATVGKYIVKELDIIQAGETKTSIRYDLKSLTGDFYSFDTGEIKFTDVFGNSADAHDFRLEGDKYLVLDGKIKGSWHLFYNAYPQNITLSITDDTVLLLDPEVYALIPLFIEGKLRQINDEDYSATVLNEFESRRMELYSLTQARNKPRATVIVADKSMLGGR